LTRPLPKEKQLFRGRSRIVISWHRFYDPSIGRYISADPIGLAGGMNLYAYVQNDPVNWVDPEGLDQVLPGPVPLLVPNTTSLNDSKVIARGLKSGLDRVCYYNQVYNIVRDAAFHIILQAATGEQCDGDCENDKGKDTEHVDNQDELLKAAEDAAGGSLDDYNNYKPDWWESPDGERRIEWNPDGHSNTNEGPHTTVRDFNGKRHGVTKKVFIKGLKKFKQGT
jgi:RHS repeat-associated protein